MKTLVRFIVFVALLSLVFPLAAVGAQEGGDELVRASDVSAVYYLSAASGSFAAQDDGSYLLTLEGVGPDIALIMTAPTLGLQIHNNANLNMQWAAAEGLAMDAVIEVAGWNISMTLTSPAYDEATGVQTFVATVTNIAAPEGVKEPEVPATFDAASLSMAWTLDFQNGLLGGITAMYEGMRATPEECSAAKTTYDAFGPWYGVARPKLDAATAKCLQGDKAACVERSTLSTEISTRWAAANAALTLLNAECK